MIVAGFLLSFLMGLGLVWSIAGRRLNPLEQLGLALPVAYGTTSMIMFLFDRVGLFLGANLMLGFLAVGTLLALGLGVWRKGYRADTVLFRKRHGFPFHISWLLLVGLIVFLTYFIIRKALFWPPVAYDTITGYDLVAKLVAAEGTLANAALDPRSGVATVRTLYPPLAPLIMAMFKMFGHEVGGIISSSLFVSVVLFLYGNLIRYTTALGAIFFTAFVCIAPDFLSSSALSTTNIPHACFAASGILLLYRWLGEWKHESLFFLGALLMGFSVWLRAEGIAMAAAGGIFVLIVAVRHKLYRFLPYYAAFTLAPYVVWEIFLATQGDFSAIETPLVDHLFLDTEKLGVMYQQVKHVTLQTTVNGIIVYIFFAALLLNLLTNLLRAHWPLLAVIMTAWVLYLLIYYQIDNFRDGAIIRNFILAGYKRSLLSFLPLFVFYVAVSPGW